MGYYGEAAPRMSSETLRSDGRLLNSGQIRCQSSGRRSSRVTVRRLSLSMATHSFSFGVRWPYITFRRKAHVVPQRAAKASRSSAGIDLRKFLSLSIHRNIHRMVNVWQHLMGNSPIGLRVL